ncbi:MAG: hypothetical protein PHR68_04600, partial [Candidatus Gracilibacteria bacterium]|nr:hypothetical protein [Candidatus Gracilibacteria bacterium]
SSYGHLKWENLKTVSQAEIDAYTTSSLVRVDGNDKVYAITPVAGGDTGAKSWINVTAAQFLGLSQSDPDSIYTINSTDGDAYSTKADITTVAQLTAFYADGTLPADVATGALNVSLSAATPEAMSIPVDSSAEFTAIKLAAGSSAVSISSITVTAGGFGTATNLDNVALYIDGAKVGSSKDINSEKEATFNFSTPISISANGSKTLTIRAIAASSVGITGAGTYKLGIAEAADIITAGGSVAGSFPIYGNGMAADTNVSTGTVTLGALDADNTLNSFGEDNVLLASFDLTANNEGAIIDSLRFKNGGTNQEGIISNLKLVIDGDEVADGIYDAATGFVTFSVDGEAKVGKSETASVEVYGDLGVATATDTIKLYIKNVDDFAFIGEDYGFGVQLTAATFALFDSTADLECKTITLTTGDVTIDMDKAATPAKDIKADTDNVVLATFEVTSNGENATLEQIVSAGADVFQIQGTSVEDLEIENVEMRDVDTGAIYDITATFNATLWDLSMTEEINLVKGVTKTFEIRADINSTADVDDTYKVVIDKEAMTITGDESDSSITDITPSTVTSAISTVKVASLTWTTVTLNNKTVVPNTQDLVIYQASLEAGTTDSVKLSTVKLETRVAAADAFNASNISKLDLYLDGKLLKSISNSIAEGTADPTKGSITFNSLITTDDANVIPAGATATLEVKASFASTLSGTGFDLTSDTEIIARTVSDNTVITETLANVAVGSRAITVANKGTLKVELLTSSIKADNDALLLAGSVSPTDKYLGELKFTTANEAIKVTELRLLSDGSDLSSDVAEVYLVDSTGAIKATKIPDADGNVVFTNLTLTFPADQATSYFIAIKAKGMNVDGDATSMATQGRTVQYHINPAANGILAQGVESGLDVALAVSADATIDAGEWSEATTLTKTAVISGAVLNSVTNALSDGTLQGGTAKIIGKYTLVFENGANRTATNEELKAILSGLTVTVSKSADVALAAAKIYREDAPATIVAADATTVWNAGTLTGLADGGKVDGSVTLVITADVTTTAADGEYLQTSLAAVNTDLDYTVNGVAVANNYLSVTSVEGGTLSE